MKPAAACLAEIPLVDLGAAGAPALLRAEPARAEALLAAGRGRLPAVLARAADRLSADWLARSGTPYLMELHEMAAHLGEAGVVFLNANYEWGCTSALAPAAGGLGVRLVRVLDWPLPGLGRHLVAARHEGPAGPWINLTWPGFAGALQGLAPGRFAAALNQAPMRRHGPARPLDWAINRWHLWHYPAMPPAHLLRLAFETCPDYGAARRLLRETPIALPAIFVLGGPASGEGCVIERTETRAEVIEAPAAAANHWQKTARRDRPRGQDSAARAARLAACQGEAGDDFAWLEPPVLNPRTRVALIADPASGRLAAQGYEAEGPATEVFRLHAEAKPPAAPAPRSAHRHTLTAR